MPTTRPSSSARTTGRPRPKLLLNALGACLMSGLANIAAARGIDLDEVTATVEGDINLLGILGLDDGVRNGYEAIRVVFHVKGAAEAAKLAALVEQSRSRSAVYDVVTNGVPVSVTVADRRNAGGDGRSGGHDAQHRFAVVTDTGRLQDHP